MKKIIENVIGELFENFRKDNVVQDYFRVEMFCMLS